MKRTRAYYRHHRERCINRKMNILKGWVRNPEDLYPDNKKGMLSKGKIHCSCPMCREKYYIEPKMSDIRKIESLDSQIYDKEY